MNAVFTFSSHTGAPFFGFPAGHEKSSWYASMIVAGNVVIMIIMTADAYDTTLRPAVAFDIGIGGCAVRASEPPVGCAVPAIVRSSCGMSNNLQS